MVVHLPKYTNNTSLFNFIKKIIAGFDYQLTMLKKPRRYDCSVLYLEKVDPSLVYYIKDLLVKPRPVLIIHPPDLMTSEIGSAVKPKQRSFIRCRVFEGRDELVEIISDFFWKLKSYLPGHSLAITISSEIEDYLTWLQLARAYNKKEFVTSLLYDRIYKDKDYQQFLAEEDNG